MDPVQAMMSAPPTASGTAVTAERVNDASSPTVGEKVSKLGSDLKAKLGQFGSKMKEKFEELVSSKSEPLVNVELPENHHPYQTHFTPSQPRPVPVEIQGVDKSLFPGSVIEPPQPREQGHIAPADEEAKKVERAENVDAPILGNQ